MSIRIPCHVDRIANQGTGRIGLGQISVSAKRTFGNDEIVGFGGRYLTALNKTGEMHALSADEHQSFLNNLATKIFADGPGRWSPLWLVQAAIMMEAWARIPLSFFPVARWQIYCDDNPAAISE